MEAVIMDLIKEYLGHLFSEEVNITLQCNNSSYSSDNVIATLTTFLTIDIGTAALL